MQHICTHAATHLQILWCTECYTQQGIVEFEDLGGSGCLGCSSKDCGLLPVCCTKYCAESYSRNHPNHQNWHGLVRPLQSGTYIVSIKHYKRHGTALLCREPYVYLWPQRHLCREPYVYLWPQMHLCKEPYVYLWPRHARLQHDVTYQTS